MGPVLGGYRGGRRVDMDEFWRVISRFSRIMVENPSVEQIEVNLLIATEEEIVSVDARVIVASSCVTHIQRETS